jgi:hypothetical protein
VVGLEDRPAGGVGSVGARPVAVELDAVAVGIGEVDGDPPPWLWRGDRRAVVEQLLHGTGELAATGYRNATW